MSLTTEDRPLIIKCSQMRIQSHDPHRQVGVAIANADFVLISTGANAPTQPTSQSYSFDSIALDPQWKYFMLEHAERNAIFSAAKAGISLAGCTIYGTLFPCADCARAIVAFGISRVVVPRPSLDFSRDAKWMDHFNYAEKIFKLADVKIDYYEPAEFNETVES